MSSSINEKKRKLEEDASNNPTNNKIIDLRSDTVTLPNEDMRKAMANAELGDDVFCEDPTVKKLEEDVAKLCGKEAGLFVVSGTMSNLLAQLVHCDGRHSEVLCGDASHCVISEVGGAAQVGGIFSRQVPTLEDGTLDLDIIKTMIRTANVHFPFTRLLILENTHNFKGGRVLSLEYMKKARKLCDDNGIKMHCDGARIWNAAIHLQKPVSVLCEVFDSVSCCLSKGLGAPVGSVLCGSSEFIVKARHCRKMLGGGMRQAGIIAAGGLYAIQNMYVRMISDHNTAKIFADHLEKVGLHVLHAVETNIVIFELTPALPSVSISDFLILCKNSKLLLLPGPSPNTVRAITHYGVEEKDIVDACSIIDSIIEKSS